MQTLQTRHTKGLTTILIVIVAMALTALLAPDSEARVSCGGKKATMVGGPGDNVLIAPAHGQQVIVGGGGDDKIVAKRNHDTVCGGGGNDVIIAGQGKDHVWGGEGNDKISTGRGKDVVHGDGGDDSITAGAGGDKLFGDAGYDTIQGDTGKDSVYGSTEDDSLNGGPGGDTVYGESGNDSLQGDAGGDHLYGSSGDDRIYGELQDDHLDGGDGDDVLVGDQGIDDIDGGSGSDWMRGGTNQDIYDGGSGTDTVSFATATPPGPTSEITGVQVDLRRGFAKGDGGQDTIRNTEGVFGSPYNDLLIGTGQGFAEGLLGADDCSDFDLNACANGTSTSSSTQVMLQGGPDPGLIVVPRAGSVNDTIIISAVSGGYSVSVSGSVKAFGACDSSGAGAFCPSPAAPLGYVVAFGGDGNDSIRIGPGFPFTTTVDLDGGNGDDRLEGNNNNDNLYAGEFGHDTLIGNSGGDALISEAGSDVLLGGPGNDQLVTTEPCDGHIFDGGTGAADVAGFGRTYDNGVTARIGGTAVEHGVSHCSPTQIRNDSEVLEGTRLNDVLYARKNKDLLIGREGKDRCVGGKHLSC